MNKILDDIFDKVNTDIPNIGDTEQEIAAEVGTLLEALQVEVAPELYTKIEKIVWQAVFTAEKSGFRLGAGYIVKLLAGCLL